MPEEIGLFEAMNSQRAIRYFKPDPVPDELIKRILEAAIRAPSGGNRQHWAFIVIRDPETRRKVADYYRSNPGTQVTPDMPRQQQRIYGAAARLAELRWTPNLDRWLRESPAPKIARKEGAGHETDAEEAQPSFQSQGGPGCPQR